MSENTEVQKNKQTLISTEAKERIESGEDIEDVINEAEYRFKEIGLSPDEIKKKIKSILKQNDVSEKSDVKQEEKESEIVPLPLLGFDYRNLDFNEDKDEYENDILPSPEKPMLSDKYKKFYENEKEFKELSENDPEAKKPSDVNGLSSIGSEGGDVSVYKKQLESKDSIIIETEDLASLIKQTHVSFLIVPPVINPMTLENIKIKYFTAEKSFDYIYVFVVDKSGIDNSNPNKDIYKTYDELLKLVNTKEMKNALFIIRELRIFNIYASEVFTKINSDISFLVFVESDVTKDDLNVIENLVSDPVFLWPNYGDMKITRSLEVDISYMTDGQAKNYKNTSLKDKFSKDKENVLRAILNVSLDSNIPDLSGFGGGPSVNKENSLKRTPKFKNIILQVLESLSEKKRILLKIDSYGQGNNYGVDAFEYIFNKINRKGDPVYYLKKSNGSSQNKNTLQSRINSDSKKSMLIVTDFVLGGEMIPKNVDKFFISGGGNERDLSTLKLVSEATNYDMGRWPRKIDIVCFITKFENNITDTIDNIDFRNFRRNLEVVNTNIKILKDNSFKISILGKRLIVNKRNYD